MVARWAECRARGRLAWRGWRLTFYFFFLFFHKLYVKREQPGNGFEAHRGSAQGARGPVDLPAPRETPQDYPKRD